MSTVITPHFAEIISCLLCNAGWLDDADENILDMLENEGYGDTEKYVQGLSDLIDSINSVLPQDDQIRNDMMHQLKLATDHWVNK